MLDANLKTQLKGYLERLTLPVELVASLDGGAKSAELKELLQEIASLSDKVTFAEADEDMRKPSFAIVRPGTDISVRFAGIPMGHEFTSLVLALLQVGGHPSKEAQDTIERVKNLDGDYTFETYFSLSCQNCPDVVQALNLMSVLKPAHPPHRDRRRPVPGRGREARRDGRALDLPEQPAVRPGPHEPGADPGQARHRRQRTRRRGDRGEEALRRAGGRRRPRRRGRGDLRGAQGHPHRHRRRALRRPGAGHDGHRELHLGLPHRGPEDGRGAGRAREGLRGRRDGLADRHQADPRDAAGRPGHGRAAEQRDLEGQDHSAPRPARAGGR